MNPLYHEQRLAKTQESAQTAKFPNFLTEEHRREIVEGSGVSPDLLEGRFWSVTREQALALGFSGEQARPGWVTRLLSPEGEISYQLKGDIPFVGKRGRPAKYICPVGAPVILDTCDPDNWARVVEGGDPIWIPEGGKKAACLQTLGKVVLNLTGVWMWGKKRQVGAAKYGRPELLSNWDRVPLEGRLVYIAFDGDYRRNRMVALAMLRFAERLTERGAHVYIIDVPSPTKGIDDYVVSGGDVGALEASARPFDPTDLISYAAKPDVGIREAVAATLVRMNRDQWTERGDATTHSLLRALLEATLLSGRRHRDGSVDVLIATRELRQLAGIGGLQTLSRHTQKLIERGYIERISGDRAKGQANRYVLKLSETVSLIEGEGLYNPIPDTTTDNLTGTSDTATEKFTPHLRWPVWAESSPGGNERDSKLPEPGATPVNFPHEKPDVPSVYRGGFKASGSAETGVSLGKTVELAIHLIRSWGGTPTMRDLATATGVNHTAKLRAKLEPLGDVFGMDPKGKHGARVWLEDGWEQALERHRLRGGEFRRARRQAIKNRDARQKFHQEDQGADKEPDLMGPERVGEIVGERTREECERRAERVGKEQRDAEDFVRRYANGDKPIRFGLLVEIWADERRETERHASWTLRKALGRLGCSLKMHAEYPGEMFVYAPASPEPEPEPVEGVPEPEPKVNEPEPEPKVNV